jgi:hypothetical protein
MGISNICRALEQLDPILQATIHQCYLGQQRLISTYILWYIERNIITRLVYYY